MLGNVAYWAGDILCLWAALQIVHSRLSVAALVLAYSGGYVLTRRALPAGGAGLVEVALTFALVGMGMFFVPALVGVIIYRLFNFWLPIVPALILLPALRDLRSRSARPTARSPGQLSTPRTRHPSHGVSDVLHRVDPRRMRNRLILLGGLPSSPARSSRR